MRATSCSIALRVALGALAWSSQSLAQSDTGGLTSAGAAVVLPAAVESGQDVPVEAFTSDELLDLVQSGRQYIILREHIDMSASAQAARHSEDTFVSPPGNVSIMVRAREHGQDYSRSPLHACF